MAAVSRIFVEKKQGYDVEAKGLYRELSENLHIDTLTSVRVINRYDVAGLNEEEFSRTIPTVFSEPQVDDFYLEEMPQTKGAVFAYEYLTGQYLSLIHIWSCRGRTIRTGLNFPNRSKPCCWNKRLI